MTTITERVAAGAAFLDEHDPEWWREIDLDALDLGSGDRCILGQRCPLKIYNSAEEGDTQYHALARHLSGSTQTAWVEKWAGERGFQVGEDAPVDLDDNVDLDDEYAALTAEWKRVITERRSA